MYIYTNQAKSGEVYSSFSSFLNKRPTPNNYTANFENPCPGPHSRHVCCLTQQTRLLCDTADMAAV